LQFHATTLKHDDEALALAHAPEENTPQTNCNLCGAEFGVDTHNVTR
jgi:hypothetical protein